MAERSVRTRADASAARKSIKELERRMGEKRMFSAPARSHARRPAIFPMSSAGLAGDPAPEELGDTCPGIGGA